MTVNAETPQQIEHAMVGQRVHVTTRARNECRGGVEFDGVVDEAYCVSGGETVFHVVPDDKQYFHHIMRFQEELKVLA